MLQFYGCGLIAVSSTLSSINIKTSFEVKKVFMKILSLNLCMILSSLGAGLYCTIASPSSPKNTIILLLGPPGSGKGTQAVTLAKELNIPHISTGDLFRENIRNKTPLGLKVKAIIESGRFVADDIVLQMLYKRIENVDCKKGFLLDGFPRTIAQAEALADYICEKTSLLVINLDVSDELITKRAEGRLTCKSCGNVYNKYFSPPTVEDSCDKCGGELYQRPDDALEVVEERLRVYHSQSKPLIEFYSNQGKLTTINGEKNRDAVYDALKKIVDDGFNA